MIQKTKTNYSSRIEGSKLYREDIESILILLSSRLEIVEIHDAKNLYDNVDDIISHKGVNLKEVSINGKNKELSLEYFSLDIEQNSIRIYSSGSEKMYSLGIEISDFIRSKEIRYYKLLKPSNSVYMTVLLPGILIFFIDKKGKLLNYHWPLWLIGGVLTYLVISLIFKNLWSSISLVREHEYGFLNRNKDKIILTVLGLVIGSIITLLINS